MKEKEVDNISYRFFFVTAINLKDVLNFESEKNSDAKRHKEDNLHSRLYHPNKTKKKQIYFCLYDSDMSVPSWYLFVRFGSYFWRLYFFLLKCKNKKKLP